MMTSSVPHCDVRIVPSDSFDEDLQTLFCFFEDYDGNSVVAAHTVTAMLVLEEAKDLTPYRRKLEELRSTALDAEKSISLISAILT